MITGGSSGIVVAACTAKAARYAVTNWHYSGCMPAPPCACYGCWADGRYLGAVIFSPGASNHLHKQFGLQARQVAELTRVALRDHEGVPVSALVPRAIALLRRASPGLALLVSFADPEHGHEGKIYQAMNWLYLGTSEHSTGYMDRYGRSVHARTVTKDGWTTQFGQRKRGHVAAELTRVQLTGKHRYALPLRKDIRRALLKISSSYPCGRGIDSDTAGVPSASAGATPACRSEISAS